MYKMYKHPDYSYVTVVEVPRENIEKIDLALCNQPTETPDKYYKRQTVKPDIITNGGFFGMANGVTCFGYRDEGKVVSRSDYMGVAITNNTELAYGRSILLDDPSVRDFISAYPPLVVGVKKYTASYAQEINYNARRTCIGWNDKTLFIVTVDKPGLKFSPLANLFVGLGATYAINLDGGGSTRMLVNGKRVTSEFYARPVDNVFCVYLKKEKPEESKIIYRVQVGAFCKKANADKLLDELKSKGITDAYVKKVGVYYKVQVGAFSVKLNADRMFDRIKALGYKPFITTK